MEVKKIFKKTGYYFRFKFEIDFTGDAYFILYFGKLGNTKIDIYIYKRLNFVLKTGFLLLFANLFFTFLLLLKS